MEENLKWTRQNVIWCMMKGSPEGPVASDFSSCRLELITPATSFHILHSCMSNTHENKWVETTSSSVNQLLVILCLLFYFVHLLYLCVRYFDCFACWHLVLGITSSLQSVPSYCIIKFTKTKVDLKNYQMNETL